MGAIDKLIEVSRKYGSNPEFVLAGGGNTSMKEGNLMYVKASGQMMASINAGGFVAMRMDALNDIWQNSYSLDSDIREEEVLRDMMLARREGETGRPSVEALLHSIFPEKFVVHMHPALVNGLTCGKEGERAAGELFPGNVLWIPLVNPGYILAAEVRTRLGEYIRLHGSRPDYILLQNHGIFIGADTLEHVDELYETMLATLDQQLVRKPVTAETSSIPENRRKAVEAGLKQADPGISLQIYSATNRELERYLKDPESAVPVSSAYTPDHIVYSGFKPLWIPETVFGGNTEDAIAALYTEFSEKNGVPPKTMIVQNTGVFTIGELALLLFLDTVKVAVYAESFGGSRFMTDDQIEFIRNWEVEKYRASIGSGN